MTRVVFDTVGFVRGLINPTNRWGRIIFDHRGDYELVVSPPLVKEIVKTFRRPEIARKFRSLPGRDPEAILDIVSRAIAVDVMQDPSPPELRDPKDAHVLATAIAGAAAYVVTEDKDLLVLGTHRGIVICDAAALLDVIGRGES